MNSPSLATPSPAIPPDWLRIVRDKVEALRFGVVLITVHDGRVTQIECTEKTRLGYPRVPTPR
jgi:hypothetical protein